MRSLLFGLAGMALVAGCAHPAADEVAAEESGLHIAPFDYPVFKTLTLPNLFGIPGYEQLEIPVYRSWGQRGPGILLVHGNSSSSRAYVRQVFSFLGATHRLYLIDLPGFGQAGKVDPSRPLPTDPNGIPVGFSEYQIGLIEAVATAAADPEIAPEVFVGWSLGGDVLLLTQGAGLLPNAKGLFIFGTAPAGANPPTAELPFDAPNVPGLPLSILASFGFSFNANPASPLGFSLDAEFTDPVPAYAPPPISDANNTGDAYIRAFFDERQRALGFVPPFVEQDAFDRSDSRARASIGAAGLGLLPPGSLPDELDVLVGLAGDPADPTDDIPIAVVVGDEDAFVNTQYLQDLASSGTLPTLWRNQIIEVRGAGHAVQFDRPFRFNRLIRQFVRDLN